LYYLRTYLLGTGTKITKKFTGTKKCNFLYFLNNWFDSGIRIPDPQSGWIRIQSGSTTLLEGFIYNIVRTRLDREMYDNTLCCTYPEECSGQHSSDVILPRSEATVLWKILQVRSVFFSGEVDPLFRCFYQGCGSVFIWIQIRIQLLLSIWIRIQTKSGSESKPNPDPNPEPDPNWIGIEKKGWIRICISLGSALTMNSYL
jgi:hypothetical protein